MQSLVSRGRLRIAAVQRPEHGEHWRAVLAAANDRVGFSTVRRTGAVGTGSRRTATLALSAETVATLGALSRGNAAALHLVVTAAVAALLHRYTGEARPLVGLPVGTDAERLAVLLPLGADLTEDTTFRALLNQLRGAAAAAVRYADYPVELLAADLGRTTEPDAHPLVDVVVAHAGLHDLAEALEHPVATVVTIDGDTVSVHCADDMFDEDATDCLARHLATLLAGAVADPDRVPGGIDLRGPADLAVVAAANDTAAEFDTDSRLPDVLARQVRLRPDAAALITADRVLTYADVDHAANRLAAGLVERGLRTGDIAAVLVPRSPELMVSILAVLKAGGAYLPVDPTLPKARIDAVLADSAARLVLCHADRAAEVDNPVRVADALSTQPAQAPDVPGKPRDLAYVIYTSGSTGTPKGVLIEHRSVLNRIGWMQRAYPLGPNDVVLQKTPASFDVSVWELFWWFFAGAAVSQLPPGAEREPASIVAAIRAHRVTTTHFVPSMLGAFLDYVEATSTDGLESLRQVFASGEALEARHVRAFARLLPHAKLINLYGPTEATVDVSHHECRGDEDTVSIGRPVDNTRLHVVALGDGPLRPQPIGVPGELCIAGVQLARGYHLRPELTAQRFVADPFPGEDRVYRTGDLARVRPDGSIDFLGRIDHQVKLRGFRIELGEIEEQLRAHPAVTDAVVVLRADASGQQVLHGYVVPSAPVEEDKLRAHLADWLPEYMVPVRVVPIEALPLSPNGKLDRTALLEPPTAESAHEAPRTEAERVLADIWADVLGRSDIGVTDSFFTLGGNSIHFVTVLARARARGLAFTFQQLFEHPTIAGLLAAIGDDAAEAEPVAALELFALLSAEDRALIPPGIADGYPLGLLQAGLIFQNEITRGTAQYHDIISFIVTGSLDPALFTLAADTLVRRHAILRTSYHLTGFGEYVQLVHEQAPTPLFIADLRGKTQAEQQDWYEAWLAEEQAYRFDWERPGLVRLHIHVLSDQLYRYSVSQHNSALDGWSITQLHTDLFGIYHDLLAGRADTRPVPANYLRAYIAMELRSLESTADREFWTGLLPEATGTDIPRERDERVPDGQPVLFHDVDISDELSDRVLALADRMAVPVKSVLLAAHVKVLGALAGTDDVLTGYEQSGRPEAEDATTALGLFLNTVPFRVNLGAGSWAELIRVVYLAEARLLPHRRYPMARMKQDIGTQDLLFETVFNYTHFYPLKQLRQLPGFDLLDVSVSTETEFALRAEFMRDFFSDRVRLSLHYHTAAFDAEQLARIGAQYRRVLKSMAADAAAPHHGESVVSAAERAALLSEVDGYVLDGHGNLAPYGVIGEYTESGPGGAGDPFRPGRGLRRTGTLARRLPGGTLERVAARPVRPIGRAAVQEEPGRTAPDTPLARQIADVWARVLGVPVERITLEDNFFDLGGGSLSAMRVAATLEGVVSLRDLMVHSTLGPLTEAVGARVAAEPARVLHRLSPDGTPGRITLVAVPYAGGNALNFRPLARQLAGVDPEVAVYAAELPGHDPSRPDEPLVSVAETAWLLAEEIRADVTGPVALWGHCVGSAIAVETARLLLTDGADLRRVFVGGKLLGSVADMQESVAEAEGMSPADTVRWLVEQSGFTELDGLRPAQTQAMVRIFRHDATGAHRALIEAFSAVPLLVPLTVVATDDDPLTPDHRARFERWSALAGPVDLREVSGGGHYFCRTRAPEVAVIVQDVLAEESTPVEAHA